MRGRQRARGSNCLCYSGKFLNSFLLPTPCLRETPNWSSNQQVKPATSPPSIGPTATTSGASTALFTPSTSSAPTSASSVSSSNAVSTTPLSSTQGSGSTTSSSAQISSSTSASSRASTSTSAAVSTQAASSSASTVVGVKPTGSITSEGSSVISVGLISYVLGVLSFFLVARHVI